MKYRITAVVEPLGDHVPQVGEGVGDERGPRYRWTGFVESVTPLLSAEDAMAEIANLVRINSIIKRYQESQSHE